MNHLLKIPSLLLICSFSLSCGTSSPKGPQAVKVEHSAILIKGGLAEVKDHLTNLILAQKGYFRVTGRWSMTIATLVEGHYLTKLSGEVLSSKKKMQGWSFSVQSLPFPHEDRSWCWSANGPEGLVVLASFSGLWIRRDGQLSMQRDQLPPQKPWEPLPL